MPTYAFTLILAGADPLALQDALYEAGCDDATFGESDSISTAHFDREAPDLTSALASAIQAVEAVAPLRVIRAELDEHALATLGQRA